MPLRRLAVLSVLAALAAARADNAALTTGGLPGMMSAHPTIRMAEEVVDLTVHANRVDTVCTFRFVNDGPACTVNMGFPDFGMWAYADTPPKGYKPRTMFRKFQSFVDGKPVPTKLVAGSAPGEQWQTKLVPFPARGTRIVKEVYTTELGGIAADVVMGAASYVLHTGSSWKGNIGKATVTVTFAPDAEVAIPLQVIPLPKNDAKAFYAHLQKPGAIANGSQLTPEINGHSLIYRKEDWRPTTKDDILVLFHYPRSLIEKMRKKGRG